MAVSSKLLCSYQPLQPAKRGPWVKSPARPDAEEVGTDCLVTGLPGLTADYTCWGRGAGGPKTETSQLVNTAGLLLPSLG